MEKRDGKRGSKGKDGEEKEQKVRGQGRLG